MMPIRRDHSIDDLYELHDDALVNTYEAAMFLGLRPGTLSLYRCERPESSPPFRRIAGKNIRYRMGDLREYLRRGEMSPSVRQASIAGVEARRKAKKGGNV